MPFIVDSMSLIRLELYHSSVYQTITKFSRTLFVLHIVLLYTNVIISLTYLVFFFHAHDCSKG
jgi:hypothetical protein